MIVIPDANIIIKSPLCSTLPWTLLALGAEKWNISLTVPNSVVVEAVAGYERRVREAQGAWNSWTKDHSMLFSDLPHDEVSLMFEVAERYERTLRETLAAMGADFIEPAEIPTLTYVHRAAARIRPFNSKGEGFRDTLLWFTALEQAAEHPDEEVVLVSNDGDFWAREEMHPDLLADLDERGLTGRVRLVRSIEDLVRSLVGEGPKGSIEPHRAKLHHEVVTEYISDKVLRRIEGRDLFAEACGLPSGVGTPRPDGQTITCVVEYDVVNLDIELQTEIRGNDVVLYQAEISAALIDGWTVPLHIDGIVLLDPYGKPMDGSIRRVIGSMDDPAVKAWLRRNEVREGSAVVPIHPASYEHTMARLRNPLFLHAID
ncbi:PIN domain-containing protein [Actinocorallia aurea]